MGWLRTDLCGSVALEETAMMRPTILTCACCGGEALGRQWWNRDTGYGGCTKCIAWMRGRGTTEEEIKQSYGIEGVHFSIPDDAQDRTLPR